MMRDMPSPSCADQPLALSLIPATWDTSLSETPPCSDAPVFHAPVDLEELVVADAKVTPRDTTRDRDWELEVDISDPQLLDQVGARGSRRVLGPGLACSTALRARDHVRPRRHGHQRLQECRARRPVAQRPVTRDDALPLAVLSRKGQRRCGRRPALVFRRCRWAGSDGTARSGASLRSVSMRR